MPAHMYEFLTRWRFRATPDEVYDILSSPMELSRWWPGVYLHVEELAPGDDDGVGMHVRFLTRGFLPYKLRWELLTLETERPVRIHFEAKGDFEGTGTWTLSQNGEETRVRFDWRISAEKPLLRRLSFLLKPLFAANHNWAMRQGCTALENELRRRRAGGTS